MKLLLIFVSALVLVAHVNGTASDGEDSVYEIPSEVVAGYVGQEAGGVGPQGILAEEAPAKGVFGAEDEPRVGAPQEPQSANAVEAPAAERVPGPESGVYIPIVSRVCTNAACANVCHRLGFKYGICVSLDTCWCSN